MKIIDLRFYPDDQVIELTVQDHLLGAVRTAQIIGNAVFGGVKWRIQDAEYEPPRAHLLASEGHTTFVLRVITPEMVAREGR